MKTKNSALYLKLLNDYYQGNGIAWREANLQKSDVLEMLSFYSRILNPESFMDIVFYIVSDLIE